ncbi:hypothetical protein THMIRHAS_03870 [Thiosulfatimonas sediminis]|uniref:Uncharacterized protein n=1 Tax=Thiosulfatimonas sediminis TaxID=2675054 RepID=A0A6F8PSK7_9GAMM|nr:hypothetical protein [Thiosulfatimonas sediminis]BBP45014.1 hypothetical protein THMIRHAS_03870 [Thiosulfatimonas sediminis]
MDKQTKILNHLQQFFFNSRDPLKGFFTLSDKGTTYRAWDFVCTPDKSVAKNRATREKVEFTSLNAVAEWAAGMDFEGAFISFDKQRKEGATDE